MMLRGARHQRYEHPRQHSDDDDDGTTQSTVNQTRVQNKYLAFLAAKATAKLRENGRAASWNGEMDNQSTDQKLA
jgi:hypothetical protein